MNAELLMFIGGVSAFALTLSWVRRRQLREKYAVGWVGLATLLLILGLVPEWVEALARNARLSYPAAVLLVSLTIIYLNSFAVSVALSALHRKEVRLAQEVAILNYRIRVMELEFAKITGQANPRETRGHHDHAEHTDPSATVPMPPRPDRHG